MIFTVMQLLVGIFSGIGLCLILLDLYRVPTMKTARAAGNLGKKGNRKVGAAEILLKDFSAFLAGKIRLGEYRKASLAADLRTAGMDTTPEGYVADALTKALAVGIFAIPVFFVAKVLSLVVLAIAVTVWFLEYRKVGKKIRTRRTKIEYELPRLVGTIEKTMQHSHDVIYMLDSYRAHAGEEMREELEITVADMRSGNQEVALTRLESRVGSTMLSDVTRGLISLIHGDDNSMYWAQLSMKFSDYQRQLLRAQANAVPRKVRKLSMALLCCFMLIYVAVIGQVLLTSLGGLF